MRCPIGILQTGDLRVEVLLLPKRSPQSGAGVVCPDTPRTVFTRPGTEYALEIFRFPEFRLSHADLPTISHCHVIVSQRRDKISKPVFVGWNRMRRHNHDILTGGRLYADVEAVSKGEVVAADPQNARSVFFRDIAGPVVGS